MFVIYFFCEVSEIFFLFGFKLKNMRVFDGQDIRSISASKVSPIKVNNHQLFQNIYPDQVLGVSVEQVIVPPQGLKFLLESNLGSVSRGWDIKLYILQQ